MPKDQAQKRNDVRSILERDVQNRLLEASEKVPTAKKWIFSENTATFPCNSRLSNLQSPVPTLEDLRKWNINELKSCLGRLDDGSLKVVPVSINSFATVKPHISKASEKFQKESLAKQRKNLVSFAYIRMRTMISKATGIPLYELADLNPLDDHPTYRWVFSEKYPMFPTRDLEKMSIDHLKQFTTALKSGEVIVERYSTTSNTNNKDLSLNNLLRPQDSRKALIEDVEKKLRLAVSKGRSKALTDISLDILLSGGPISHPKDMGRTYRWKFTNSYPCFPSKERSFWEWESADLIRTSEAIDNNLLSFGLDVPEQTSELRDEPVSKVTPTRNGNVPSKSVIAMNETHAINSSSAPSSVSFSGKVAEKSMQIIEANEKPRETLQQLAQPTHGCPPEPSSRIQNTDNISTLATMNTQDRHEVANSFLENALHTRSSSTAINRCDAVTLLNTTNPKCGNAFIKEIEEFLGQEETTNNNVEDQIRTLMEGFRNSAITRKSLLSELSSQFATLSYRAKTQELEISQLQEKLDKETSNKDAVARELSEIKAERDLLSSRMTEECKKAREEGQREALEHEHRRQISVHSATSLTHLQEIQREREKAFKEGQESARQSMSTDYQLLNQEFTKAQAEIERLRYGPTETVDETVHKIEKNHNYNNDKSHESTSTNSNPPTPIKSPDSSQDKLLTPTPTLRYVTATSNVSHKPRNLTQTPKSLGNHVPGIKRALASDDDDDDLYGVSPPRAKRPAHNDKVREMVERNRIHHGGLGGGESLRYANRL